MTQFSDGSAEISMPRSEENLTSEISVGYYSIASTEHPERNEDRVLIIDNRAFGIFDGMGGHSNGDRASALVAEFIRERVEQMGDTSMLDPEVVGDKIGTILEDANGRLFAENRRLNVRDTERMGTTASFGYIWPGNTRNKMKLIGVSIGDSRIYVIDKNGKKKAETLDDNLSKPTVPTNQLDEETKRKLYAQQQRLSEANGLADLSSEDQSLWICRHMLSQALGIREKVYPSIHIVELDPGDRIVLLSDGVLDNNKESQTMEIVNSQEYPDAAANVLVSEALNKVRVKDSRAKADDMSAVVVKVGGHPKNLAATKEGYRGSIAGAQDWESLFSALEARGQITGSETVFESRSLRQLIEEVRSGKIDINRVTRSEGLRDKVKELMRKEGR